jgi:hypothetical protein
MLVRQGRLHATRLSEDFVAPGAAQDRRFESGIEKRSR